MTAQRRSSPTGQEAFAELCEMYWYPLYVHARTRERDPHLAKDLVQGFFAKVMEKNYLSDVDPQRGRFRTFLLASFGNYLANEFNKSRTLKRGGGVPALSLDWDAGERRYPFEPAEHMTAEQQYERLWAQTLLKQVLDQLRQEHQSAGREQVFEELQHCLTQTNTESYASIGQRLSMSEDAVKSNVYRLKSRFRRVLREEIAKTVSDPHDVDDEIRYLFQTFS